MMHRNRRLILIIINVFCTYYVTGQEETPATYQTNCFQQNNSGKCEESWIKICTDYYICDMVIDLESPPKRIGFVDGEILVAIGSQMYNIINGSLQALPTRKFIPPWDEFVDKNDNRYYAADGTTYMSQSESNKEIEILTTGEHSFNQLVYDIENGRLFILAFRPTSEEKERGGSLFAINTNTMNITENDKAQAEKVEAAGDRITAMAIEGEVNKLLLGLRTEEGGKLIRLTRQSNHPCAQNNVKNSDKRNAILEIIKETQDKLIKIFEEASTSTDQPKNLLFRADDTPKLAERENERLKRELYVATTKLERLKSTLFVFNRNLRGAPALTVTPASMLTRPEASDVWRPPGPPGRPGLPGLNFESNIQGPSLRCISMNEAQTMIDQKTRDLEELNMDLKNLLQSTATSVSTMLIDLADDNNNNN